MIFCWRCLKSQNKSKASQYSKFYKQGVGKLTNELDIECLLKLIRKSNAVASIVLTEHQKALIEYLPEYWLAIKKPK